MLFLASTGAVTGHLTKHHGEVWSAYCEAGSQANAAKVVIKEEVAACEMENAEVRFYDVRSSKGRLPFLKKVSFCSISTFLV